MIRIDVRLIPAAVVVRPGERIAYSLVNRGATSVVYGEAFRIECNENARWVSSGPERHFRAWGRTLRPGEQVELSAPIHDDALPGRYRVIKGIGVNPNAEPRSPRTHGEGWSVAEPPGARRETVSFEFRRGGSLTRQVD